MANEVKNITNDMEFKDAPNPGMQKVEELFNREFPGLAHFAMVIAPDKSGSNCMTYIDANSRALGTILVDFGNYLLSQENQKNK